MGRSKGFAYLEFKDKVKFLFLYFLYKRLSTEYVPVVLMGCYVVLQKLSSLGINAPFYQERVIFEKYDENYQYRMPILVKNSFAGS